MTQPNDNANPIRSLITDEEQLPLRPTYLRDFLQRPKLGSQAYRDLILGQAGVIQGNPYDQGVVATLDEQEDANLTFEQESNNYYNALRGQIDAGVQQTLNHNPGNLREAVQAGIEGAKNINRQQLRVTAKEEAYVTQVAPNSPDTMDESRRRELALDIRIRNELASMQEEAGTLDKALDFASYVVPFGTAKDISDINSELRDNPALEQLASENLETIATKWKSLPVEQREEMYPALISAVREATKTNILGLESDGNITKTVSFIQTLLGSEGGERLNTEQNIDIALGLADVVPVTAVAKAVRGAKAAEKVYASRVLETATQNVAAQNSAIKVAEKAGDIPSATIHAIRAVSDDTIARKVGTTQHVAAQSLRPFHPQLWQKEVAVGLTPDASKIFNDIQRQAEGFAARIGEESELAKVGALTASERNVAVTNWQKRFAQQQEDYLNEGIHIQDLQISNRTDEGFTYRYTVHDEFNSSITETDSVGRPLPTVVTGEVKFTTNNITGTYSSTVNSSTAQSGFASKVLSPAAWSVGSFNDAVKSAMVAADLTAGNSKRVGDMMLWALEPVRGVKNVKARGRIEDVLTAGDEYVNPGHAMRGKVFTPQELAAGVEVPGKGTVRLTAPNEVEAYYRTRFTADSFWQQQNGLVRRELELGGFKHINITPENAVVGKPFDRAEDALRSVENKPGFRAFDSNANKTISITPDEIARQYERGNILVRTRKDYNTKGTGDFDRSGEFVEYAFVKRGVPRDLPVQVLHYKPGYMPKINKAEFFVGKEMPIIKGGVQGAVRREAVRAFNSKADAEAFRQAQIDAFLKRNPEYTRGQVESIYKLGDSTELNKMNRLEEAVSSGNGLYTGDRAKDDILFGLAGSRLERVSPLEALQRNTQHLGKGLTRNELRIGEEKRWLNTVKKMLPEVRIEGFNATRLPDTPQGKALEAMRRQINEWNAVPEFDETLFTGAIQSLHDFMLHGVRKAPGFKDKDSIHSLLYLKHFSPFQAIKAANMHVFLGMLNPAQIYVQASAAAVAFSRHAGGLTTKNADAMLDITTAWKFGLLDNIKDAKGYQKAVKEMIKDGQLKQADVEAYEAFRKTGYYDSVFNNADTAYMQGTGAGASMKVMSQASNVSLMFYRAGEMFNRRYSFIRSYKAWKEANPNKAVDNDAILAMIKDSNESMLELNTANRAWWQGGAGTGTGRQILGMSTQFLQVMGKTMELAVKGTGRGGWTNAEKGRILAGQVLLFGSAGIPIFNAAPGAVANWLGFEPDEKAATFIRQGMTGAIVANMVGAEIDVANRAALGGQILTTWRDLLLSDESLVVKALGVSGETGSRFMTAMSEMSVLAQAPRHGVFDLDKSDVKAALHIIAQVPTSSRNILKAYIMHNFNRIDDRRNRPVVFNDFELQTEIATAFGFKPTQETSVRMTQIVNRDIDELVQDVVDTRIKMIHDWIYIHNGSPEYGRKVQHAMQIIDELVDNPAIEAQIRESIGNRILRGNSQSIEDREVQRFIENVGIEHLSESYIYDVGIFDSRVEQGIIQPLSKKLGTKN